MAPMTDDSSLPAAGDVVGPRMRRRDVLALAGTAAVGAAFGFRHLFAPTGDAFAASCLLRAR